MLYATGKDWLHAPQKRAMLFGMSGLGKTHVAEMLRRQGGWFHYSIDYRIGTRYMGEYIADNAKQQGDEGAVSARSVCCRIRSHRLEYQLQATSRPLPAYLGKPGDPAPGRAAHRRIPPPAGTVPQAEIRALLDTPEFHRPRPDALWLSISSATAAARSANGRSRRPRRPDPAHAVGHTLLIWIEGTAAHTRGTGAPV
jgi:hypothetical protein